jgi:Holliday junction resolvase RusA-like endonuclease
MYKIVMLKKSCTIEEPFSANKMYAPIARGKMVKSKKYIEWIEKNVVIIKNNLLPATQFPIDVEILIMADFQWKLKCDADNIIKPLIDLLVRAEIVPDDKTRFINSVKVRYLQGFGKPVTCISYLIVED